MTQDEKRAALDKILTEEKGGKIAHVVACSPGSYTSRVDGGVTECFVCDQKVLAFKATLEKQKTEGWLVLCTSCWGDLVRRFNSAGKQVMFGGRIRDNKIHEANKHVDPDGTKRDS